MSQRKIERDGSYTIREIVKVVAISLSRMHFIVKLFGFFFSIRLILHILSFKQKGVGIQTAQICS